MRICPGCAFSNPEGNPTCLSCNRLLLDVPLTPADDPEHPEHAREQFYKQKWARRARQRRVAIGIYGLGIVATAVCPGFIFNPLTLSLYALGALLTANLMVRQITGPFAAHFVQGAFSTAVFFILGPIQPFGFFMLVTHITLPALLQMWFDGMSDMGD